LKGNAGLVLPSNIGELGDSVTEIDLNNHNLRGELSIRTERFGFLFDLYPNFVASGRVPKELANLTNLVTLSLYGNQLRVPDGTLFNYDGRNMYYNSREAVAAFQACLS
jgi:Leucine-rich repeat (LRR) protein